MIDLSNPPQDILDILKNIYGDGLNLIKIPPTAFTAMQGKLLEYDIGNGYLKTEFPVLDIYLNQFGNMQGGIVAGAIDNTFGPLSMLIAQPNFTRRLEVKYKKPISPDIEIIYVEAHLVEIKRQKIFLEASVYDRNNQIYAKAKAMHWIIENKN